MPCSPSVSIFRTPPFSLSTPVAPSQRTGAPFPSRWKATRGTRTTSKGRAYPDLQLTNGVLVRRSALLYSPKRMPASGLSDERRVSIVVKTARTVAEPVTRQDRWPVIPDRIEDLGIPRSLVTDLILRYLWLHGSGTLATLNTALKLSFPVLEVLFHQFRQQQLLEVKGMLGDDYSFTLTNAGRVLATARNEVCQYAGPAPVSIQKYHQVVKSQAAHVKLSRESLRRAFRDLVLADALLDQLGPALIGHQSLFL